MKINVLGTEYTITTKKYAEDESFEKRGIAGYCDEYAHSIVICDMSTYPSTKDESSDTQRYTQKHILRHEIVHAFFGESGLDANSIELCNIPWAQNEEMVDWIALQGPKIYKAWLDADAL